ncbi:uncharacterized protein LOC142319879 [Lycorma delicatula]|uniref:uncharacterized protein LOC142319879 n=1 Tax=Lycorma delicatula TaxID=130591 RepID=UPI003F510850
MRLKQDSTDGSLVVPASMSRNITQWTDKFSDTITERNKSSYNIKNFTTQQDTLSCVFYTSDDLHLSHCQELDPCSGTSSDISPGVEEENSASSSVSSDSDSEEGNLLSRSHGIINPNYPGFQDLADQLNSDEETTIFNNNNTINNNNSPDTNTSNINNNNQHNNSNININSNNNDNNNHNNSNNNNNNNIENLCNIDSVNQLDSVHHKTFYDTPKFNLPVDSITTDLANVNLKSFDTQLNKVKDLNISNCEGKNNLENLEVKCFNKKQDQSDCVQVSDMATNIVGFELLKENNKMADAFLSGVKDEIRQCEDTNRNSEKLFDKLTKEDQEKETNDKEKEDDPVIPRKKEKMEINYNVKKGWVQAQSSNLTVTCRPRSDVPRSSLANRRSLPSMREKKKTSPEVMGGFDVYNIETAMPHIDLDAIESHLRAAREEERRNNGSFPVLEIS